MIKKIKLQGTPPFLGSSQFIEPKKINFIFGLNGSGKTTLSRYIRYPEKQEYHDCYLEWDGVPIRCEIYNSDYVQENFNESSIPGIFTLGEENIETKRQIDNLSHEIEALQNQINSLSESIKSSDGAKGLEVQLASLEKTYTKKFWEVKQKLDKENSPLLLALKGVRGSKEIFKSKLLEQYRRNRSDFVDKTKLEDLCFQLFEKNSEKLSIIPMPSFDDLIQFEQSKILSKIVVGKDDVDIGGLIKKLRNDSWFHQGLTYIEKSNGLCPFCQRPLASNFNEKVSEYFDQNYTAAIKEIENILTRYTQMSDNILSELNKLANSEILGLNAGELTMAYQQFNIVINNNIEKLSQKKLSPNIAVTLEPINEIANCISDIINDANQAIKEYNIRIENIEEERKKTTDSVWRYILDNLSNALISYIQEKEKLDTEISNINKKIKELEANRNAKNRELHSLEQTLTSIIPTATGINELLINYGFTGFSIKVDSEGKSYQFVRDNGTPAYTTLSEGERNFVTFLYFIYSLKGNINESRHNNQKVVVVDDPVSSLDNDVLFIVSSLLRDMFRAIYDDNSSIKQLFVLSHNLYFFKEVSYDQGLKKDETGYWMIVKSNEIAKINQYKQNPVSSTYEMLWNEVRNAYDNQDSYNSCTLANTMRRILEHYFKFLGGIDLSKLHLQFTNGERQVFKSLISWTNAGSHSGFDDFSATPNIYNVENYLKVFKDLFEKTGQLAHYNMMMKIDMEDN